MILTLGLSVLNDQLLAIPRSFQLSIILATSSPTFPGDRPRGLTLGARADVVPTLPYMGKASPIHGLGPAEVDLGGIRDTADVW